MKIDWDIVKIAAGVFFLLYIWPIWIKDNFKRTNELYLSASLKSCESTNVKCLKMVKKSHRYCFKKWYKKNGQATGMIILKDEYFECMTKKTGIKEWEKPKYI